MPGTEPRRPGREAARRGSPTTVGTNCRWPARTRTRPGRRPRATRSATARAPQLEPSRPRVVGREVQEAECASAARGRLCRRGLAVRTRSPRLVLDPFDEVVLLAAVTAKGEGKSRYRSPGDVLLPGQGDVAVDLGLERGEAALEPRETNWCSLKANTAAAVAGSSTRDPASRADRSAARRRLDARPVSAASSGRQPVVPTDGPGVGPHQPSLPLGHPDRPTRSSGPRGRRRNAAPSPGRTRRVRPRRCRQRPAGSTESAAGGPFQRLADDVRLRYGRRRRAGDATSATAFAGRPRYRRSPWSPRSRCTGGLGALHASRTRRHQQRHVGPLAAPVGVQLVQDEELKALGRRHQLALVGPGEDQLQHHVVGEQDVRRVGDDPLALPRRLSWPV